MNKLGDKIILFILSITLGIVIMMQFKTTQGVIDDSSLDIKSVELNSELAKLTQEKNELLDELDRLRNEADVSEQYNEDREKELNEIKLELDKQKIISGYYDVKGPGAIIKISQVSGNYVSLAYSHQYILALISYLNNAGVEAISINGQRYTSYTEIVPVLDHINVNRVAMVLPLEIKAIGNSRTIEASLNFVGGIVTQMEQLGFIIETEYIDEIFVNKFTGQKDFKYAVPYEADMIID